MRFIVWPLNLNLFNLHQIFVAPAVRRLKLAESLNSRVSLVKVLARLLDDLYNVLSFDAKLLF
jgi:hypothetical protein